MEELLLEVCVESARAAAVAEAGGADRIELCRDLAVEGLTPGTRLLSETRAACGSLLVVADVRLGQQSISGTEVLIHGGHDDAVSQLQVPDAAGLD